jgi:xylulokinase
MAILLGIDVGTSSTKAVLIDTRGRVLATASAAHPIVYPRPGWSEQDPLDWWKSTCRAVRTVLKAKGVKPAHVGAIGLSGQMHGSVFLGSKALANPDLDAPPEHAALLWNDQRTAEDCAHIAEALGGRRGVVRATGNAPLTGFQLPKIVWLRRTNPRAFARTRMVLLPKDYIRFRLCGALASDVGDASGTLAYDVAKRRWSRNVMSALDLDPALFPPVYESAQTTGPLRPAAAKLLGLPAGIPIIAGSGDNQAGAVGAGVVTDGFALAALGTSGVIYAHSPAPHPDLPLGRTHAMCAADGSDAHAGAWCITGVMLSAAGSLQWLRDTLFPRASFEELLARAQRVKPGADGLLFLPHLTGERCPHADPCARGAFVGLSTAHTPDHLVRAVVEGVTVTMARILNIVRTLGVSPAAVRLGGGGAKSAFWRQMQADAYGVPVELPNTEEGPAFGAAILAGVGCGVWPSVAKACAEAVRVKRRIEPGRGVAAMAEIAALHEPVYASLAPTFAAIAGVKSAR